MVRLIFFKKSKTEWHGENEPSQGQSRISSKIWLSTPDREAI